MNTKICVVKGVFDNIYFWGQGYKDLETAQKWNEYWENSDISFWEYQKPKFRNCSGSLVSTGGSIYMHPMDFRTVLHSSGVKCPKGHDDDLEDYFGSSLDALKKACEEVAELCGGTFRMFVQCHDVKSDDLREW